MRRRALWSRACTLHPVGAVQQVSPRALGIALFVGGVPALVQPMRGDLLTQTVAKHQPVKLAAMEGHFKTEKGAALRIGGFPDGKRERSLLPRSAKCTESPVLHDPDAT